MCGKLLLLLMPKTIVMFNEILLNNSFTTIYNNIHP